MLRRSLNDLMQAPSRKGYPRMTYIGQPPIERVIPVTRGCDRRFTVQRTQDDEPTAFDAGSEVYMWVDIDKAAPTRVDAVVDGTDALFALESELLDQVRNTTRFRIVLDVDTFEIPLVIGRFERHDG